MLFRIYLGRIVQVLRNGRISLNIQNLPQFPTLAGPPTRWQSDQMSPSQNILCWFQSFPAVVESQYFFTGMRMRCLCIAGAPQPQAFMHSKDEGHGLHDASICMHTFFRFLGFQKNLDICNVLLHMHSLGWSAAVPQPRKPLTLAGALPTGCLMLQVCTTLGFASITGS